jgi:hydrogenase maturation protease
MSTSSAPRAVVIGAGNTLLSDEGFGAAVLERLRADGELAPGVELVDGGTWGMNLLPVIEDADALIIVDAIDVGWPAGSPVTLERDSIPRLLGIKLSPHQIDLRETLAVAELRGHLPARTVAIGVQPLSLETRIGLSPLVQSRVEEAAALVVLRLRRWGWRCGHHAQAGACTS